MLDRSTTAPPAVRVQDCLGDMHYFVAVARAKNFKRAAHALGIPASTLSRRISALEAVLGFRLFVRTTRSVELTEDGVAYLARAAPVIDEAQTIHEDLNYGRGRTRGLLRVAIPECTALQVATPWFAEFAALHPEVQVHIDTAPEHVDPVRDGFDLSISHSEVHFSTGVKRTIAAFKRVLFASPHYAAAHGLPTTPEELADHQCIGTGDGRSQSNLWTLHRDGERRTVEVRGQVSSVSQALAPELAREGLGIASAMPRPFQPYVDAGLLVPVLPDWQLDPMELTILMPDRLASARARAFIDFFTAKFHEECAIYERFR